MATSFDVWLVHSNTVYKGVPFGVVTGWAEQGRLGKDDKLRPAGVETAWTRAADHELISDYLFQPPPAAAPKVHDPVEELEPIEMEFSWRKSANEEDEDPDMIPLIDVSLVLLVFFMMTATVSALSPVSVPEMKHAADLRTDPNAITVIIDKRDNGDVIYAVRVGERSPRPEDNNLTTAGQAIDRLKARVAESKDLPEVRIACNKDLPRMHVRTIARDLDRMQREKKIKFFNAEVNEKK